MRVPHARIVSLLALLAFVVLAVTDASPARAQAARSGYRWELHRSANMKVEIPIAWTLTTDGDVLVAKPTKPGLGIELVGIERGAAEATKAEQTLLAGILKRMPDARATGPAKPVAQNGLSGVVVQGEGTRGGQRVEWFSVVRGDGRGRGLLAVGLAAKGRLAEHRAEVVEIFNSIRPAE